eukprot:scaffold16087_cov48-Attheya_sp.AAC.6
MGFGGGSMALSHLGDANEDENDNVGSKRRMTRAIMMDMDEMDGQPASPQEEATPSTYGRDALDQLKAQQKVYVAAKQEKKEDIAPPRVDKTTPASTTVDRDTSLDMDYLPLNSQHSGQNASPSVIVAGDVAMSYLDEEQDDDQGVHATVNRAKETTPEDNGMWEQEIERRAGIGASAPPKRTASTANGRGQPAQNGTDASFSLSQLRMNMEKTVETLGQTNEELESTQMRRRNECEAAQTEQTRQDVELAKTGHTFEYHQELRWKLAQWVGALRDLQKNYVEPAEAALQSLYKEMGRVRQSRWAEWQSDTIITLREQGLLLCTIPPTNNDEDNHWTKNVTTVDEFGRDVKSMHVLARERRAHQRRKLTVNHNPGEAWALTSGEEVEGWIQRRKALRDAMNVVTNDLMAEEYVSLPQLFQVFLDWKRVHPEEYQQCYATLSLADLAAVLIQAKMCVEFEPLLLPSTEDDGRFTTAIETCSWFPDMVSFETSINATVQPGSSGKGKEQSEVEKEEDTSLMDLFFSKTILSQWELLLKQHDLTIERETQSLSRLFYSLYRNMKKGDVKQNMLHTLTQHWKSIVQSITVPVLDTNTIPDKIKHDVGTADAISFATVGQLYYIKSLVHNLISCWCPVLNELTKQDGIGKVQQELASLVLIDLIGTRLLPILHHDKTVLNQIWEYVKQSGWLNQPGLMLFAAPLRAAAASHGINT